MTDARDPDTPEAADAPAPDPATNTVNSQILDAVNAINAIAAVQAPISTAAMLDLASAQAIGLGMYNALFRQQADATLGTATMAAACARIAGVTPPTAGAVSSAGPVAWAEAQARAAIVLLKVQAAQPGGEPANAALERLAAEAGTQSGDPE